MPTARTLVLAALAALPLATLAIAQPTPAGPARREAVEEQRLPRDGERPAVTFSITPFALFVPEGGLDEVDTEIGVTRVGGRLGLGFRVGERSNLALGWRSEFSLYDFTRGEDFTRGIAGAPALSEPWDDAAEHSLSLLFTSQVRDDWTLILGADVTSGIEGDADFGDSLTYGGLAGVAYRFSDTLTAGVALAVRSRLEDDVRVIPAPFVQWQISEKWRLAAGDEGPGVRLSYQASESVSVFAEGGWLSREYRLDDEGLAPDGVLTDDRVPVGLGLRYAPSQTFFLTLRAGAMVYQEYQVDDRSGNELVQREGDVTPYVGIEAGLRF